MAMHDHKLPKVSVDAELIMKIKKIETSISDQILSENKFNYQNCWANNQQHLYSIS